MAVFLSILCVGIFIFCVCHIAEQTKLGEKLETIFTWLFGSIGCLMILFLAFKVFLFIWTHVLGK